MSLPLPEKEQIAVGQSQFREIQNRMRVLYSKLRLGITRNVIKEYIRTGYIWEQYEDSTGKGIRGHPFTGWSALVVNILFEKY